MLYIVVEENKHNLTCQVVDGPVLAVRVRYHFL